MKTAVILSAFCAIFLPTDATNICGYCDVLNKCIRSSACKYYAAKCKCEASSECGIMEIPSTPRISTFIVGGDDAAECELPWTVAIFYKGNLKCGGTIIDDRHIISAAHCFSGSTSVKDIMVGLGSSDRRETRKYMISDFIQHPEHYGDVNDIAILTLKNPISFSKCARPICLPPAGYQYKTNDICIVAGWGLTSEGILFQPFQLQKVKVPLIDWSTCNTAYNMADTQLCAGYFEKGGKDACKTDSGGPLICNYNNRWTLVGVVSSGIGCALPGYPGKYTEVSKYKDWIDFETGNRTPYHY